MTGQLLQTVDPGVAPKVPTGQVTQEPDAFTKLPAGQVVHREDPAVEVEPEGHAEQLTLPGLALYVLTGQLLHTVDPAVAPKVPIGQETQEPEELT